MTDPNMSEAPIPPIDEAQALDNNEMRKRLTQARSAILAARRNVDINAPLWPMPESMRRGLEAGLEGLRLVSQRQRDEIARMDAAGHPSN